MVLKEKKKKYKKSELLHLPVIISFIIIKSIRANFFYIFIERQFKNKRQYLTHTHDIVTVIFSNVFFFSDWILLAWFQYPYEYYFIGGLNDKGCPSTP